MTWVLEHFELVATWSLILIALLYCAIWLANIDDRRLRLFFRLIISILFFISVIMQIIVMNDDYISRYAKATVKFEHGVYGIIVAYGRYCLAVLLGIVMIIIRQLKNIKNGMKR